MSEIKHTKEELYQMQSLPLSDKIHMTERRIREWVEEYGEDGVYISFSGGKDSNVILDIARKMYPNIKGVFIDTGLEYPDVREWIKTFDNITWVKPKYTYKQVIQKYGYPFISKEISGCVYDAKQYITGKGGYASAVRKLCGLGEHSRDDSFCSLKNHSYNFNAETTSIMGDKLREIFATDEKLSSWDLTLRNRGKFNCEKYAFFLEDGAPPICDKCCRIMKKTPIQGYERKNKLKGITGQMATESRLRTQQWIRNGCNGFDMEYPTSNPIAFWTEQDVLLYVYENHLPICPMYGEVVEDSPLNNQNNNRSVNSEKLGLFEKERPTLKTTGCARTGCVFCGFGLQFDKDPNRLEQLSVSHPNLYDYVMRGGAFDENGDWRPDSRGLGYWYCIEWINLHGGFNINYTNREHYINSYSTDETKKFLAARG